MEMQTIIRGGQPISRYKVERVLDPAERFIFSSHEVGLRRFNIKAPRYYGSAVLRLYVAKIDIHNRRNGSTHSVVTELGPECSMYARSRELEQRYWAGYTAVSRALRDFVDGRLESSDKAEEFYESLTPEQLALINLTALEAE